jgi:hypothetical protein
MHGVIHLALRKYIESTRGTPAWLDILERAGVSTALPYVRVGHYPDEELVAIVAAAAAATGVDAQVVLEEFGAFIAPDLMVMYPRLIRPEWRTLDLLCHTEEMIHQIVRQQNPGTYPAIINCARTSGTEVRLTYASPRRLCSLARGIIRGVAKHYGETVTVDERACARRGDEACVLVVRTGS